MQEYVSNAIVLRKESWGDLDGRYACFTERFGKIWGKAKSSRKITSKLAPHLEPGSIVRVRFLERTGTQIVDALKESQVPLSLNELHLLYQILPDGQPESALWDLLVHGKFSWLRGLEIFGWDPRAAQCGHCGRPHPEYFYVPRQEFFCDLHASKLPRGGVILIEYGV